MATEPGAAIDDCFLWQGLEFFFDPGDLLLLSIGWELVCLSFN